MDKATSLAGRAVSGMYSLSTEFQMLKDMNNDSFDRIDRGGSSDYLLAFYSGMMTAFNVCTEMVDRKAHDLTAEIQSIEYGSLVREIEELKVQKEVQQDVESGM